MSRTELDALHARLLEHHKVLLDATRADYERTNGPVGTAGAFLQLLIQDEAFAWLRPMTTLLVELDDADTTPDVTSARAKVARLFSAETPGFHPNHERLVAESPEAARSYARTRELLADA